MERLAEEVSKGENSGKKLAWQTVQQWETKTAPKRSRLKLVAELLDIPKSKLMELGEVADDEESLDGSEFPLIKRVRLKLENGAPGFEAIPCSDAEPIIFPRAWYEKRGLNPSKLLALTITNSSMEPRLVDGDTVIVNTESVEPKDGFVFAINYEGELDVKRLMRNERRWFLNSDNPDKARYPRKSCAEDVYFVGEVVHKQSDTI